jgi:hypothetical protein
MNVRDWVERWVNRHIREDNEECFRIILARYAAATSLSLDDIKARVDVLKLQVPTNASVLELELLRLSSSGIDQLRQEIPELRRKWATLSGQTASSKALDQCDKNSLLAEASFLTTQLLRQYYLREKFAIAKRQTVLLMFTIFVVGVVVAWLLSRRAGQMIIAEEMIVGMIGGYVSSFLRVYTMPPGDDILLSVTALRADRASLIAKPLLGAVFAVALHLLFISGLLSGGLFPVLKINPEGSKGQFKQFFTGTVIATDADFAKLLVWCFIGGFAERLVPDILDRLANQADKEDSKK